MGDPVKGTIVARGTRSASRSTSRRTYLHARGLIDWMTIGLAGQAAEQVVFSG
jgi:hypothetical protein